MRNFEESQEDFWGSFNASLADHASYFSNLIEEKDVEQTESLHRQVERIDRLADILDAALEKAEEALSKLQNATSDINQIKSQMEDVNAYINETDSKFADHDLIFGQFQGGLHAMQYKFLTQMEERSDNYDADCPSLTASSPIDYKGTSSCPHHDFVVAKPDRKQFLTSPGYSRGYGRGHDCIWTLVAPDDGKVHVQFVDGFHVSNSFS